MNEWKMSHIYWIIRVYLYLSVCQFYMTRFIVLCTLGNYLYTCQYTYEDIYVRTIKDKEYHTCMCLTYMYHTCLADKTSQHSPFSLQQSFRFLFLKVISTLKFNWSNSFSSWICTDISDSACNHVHIPECVYGKQVYYTPSLKQLQV